MLRLAGHCYFCQQVLHQVQQGICSFCLSAIFQLATVCPRCGLPSGHAGLACGRCQLDPPYWQHLCFINDYCPPLNQLVKRLKFYRQVMLVNLLARLLLLCWRQQYRLRIQQPIPLVKADLLLSVPLYRYRHWQRGYNQADLLAQQLARDLAIAYRPTLLQRYRSTTYQYQLSAAARRRNLRGAFMCQPQVADKHILLLDDVVTTGSTVNEISRLLLANHAKSVQVLAICRTF